MPFALSAIRLAYQSVFTAKSKASGPPRTPRPEYRKKLRYPLNVSAPRFLSQKAHAHRLAATASNHNIAEVLRNTSAKAENARCTRWTIISRTHGRCALLRGGSRPMLHSLALVRINRNARPADLRPCRPSNPATRGTLNHRRKIAQATQSFISRRWGSAKNGAHWENRQSGVATLIARKSGARLGRDTPGLLSPRQIRRGT